MNKKIKDHYRKRIASDFEVICNYYNSKPVPIRIYFSYIAQERGSCVICHTKPENSYITITIPNRFRVYDYDRIRHVLVHESIHIFEKLDHNYKSGYKVGYYSRFDRDTYTPKVVKTIFR
jgi:predicted metal-dependent hydrolase